MSYAIKQATENRESFGEYKYNIYQDGKLVAHYWHDYRGDEHGIDFVSGGGESDPVGRMTDFIEGGGPQPLKLSVKAIKYLNSKLGF